MRRRNRAAAIFSFAIVLCACQRREEQLFAELRDAPRDSVRARANGLELSKSRRGVDLAIADMDIFGGSTRGWSSWILIASESADLVDPSLKKVLSDGSLPRAKRLEAANILWLRTKDAAYLEELFRMVQPSGDLEIEWGRRALGQAFAPDDVKKVINTPAGLALPLSEQQFSELLRDPKNLRIPGGNP